VTPPPHEQVALFHWNGLGDHLLALPAMRALERGLPGPVTVLEGPGKHFVLTQDLTRARSAPFFMSDPFAQDVDVTASVAAAGRCDVFLSMASWVNPTLLALARGMGARRTVGFFFPFDEPVPAVPERHMFEDYFALARHLLPETRFEDHTQPPVYSAAARAAARELRGALVGPGDKLLFVHPETLPVKMWTPAGLAVALRQFLSARTDYVAVVMSQGDYPLPLGDLGRRVHASHAHLELALALLSTADLFLGVDSVFLHAADLERLPGVALFGPATSAGRWGFHLSPGGRHVSAASLSELPPGPVVEALLEAAE
jgi:ADP-heptose:LPS heptosyltransferase